MGKGKDISEELSGMLRGVPSQNILIAFDDKKSTQKKRRPRHDRER